MTEPNWMLELADLSGADLSGADLSEADLSGAYLRQSDIAGNGGRKLPIVTQLHVKMLQALDAGGALKMDSWHTCETTHCRAGWAITLAGKRGAELESELGPAMAGALITLASCPKLERVPDFHASNEAAMASIRAAAELEVEQ